MSADVCHRCNRPLFRRKNTHPVPDGLVQHGAHGYCHTCYSNGHRSVLRMNRRAGGRPTLQDDIDEVAVQRAIDGTLTDPANLNTAERRAVVAKLTARGMSAVEIGRRLGITSRSVQRHRTALREERGAA